MVVASAFTSVWLAQVVDGNRLIMTPYDLSFRKDKADAKLCTKTLTKSEVMQFRKVPLSCCFPRHPWLVLITVCL